MTLDELIKLGNRATPRPWHWWTSNSTRRLGSGDRDGNVAFGQRCSDGCPDIAISERDMAYSEAACNAAVQLAQAHKAALEKIARIREMEPQIRLIVETVAPNLARELTELLKE